MRRRRRAAEAVDRPADAVDHVLDEAAAVQRIDGLQRRRGLGTVGTFTVLISVALWITIDFDYPRRGLIKVSNKPFVEARGAMVGPQGR